MVAVVWLIDGCIAPLGLLLGRAARHDHRLLLMMLPVSALMVLLGLGLVFELPIFVLGLVSIGVLSSATLRKNRRLGYFVVAVIALGLPGPDPVTTGLELLPMWALFEGSIWLAFFVERARPNTLAADRFDAVA